MKDPVRSRLPLIFQDGNPRGLAAASHLLNWTADVLEGMEDGRVPMVAEDYRTVARLAMEILSVMGRHPEIQQRARTRRSLRELTANLGVFRAPVGVPGVPAFGPLPSAGPQNDELPAQRAWKWRVRLCAGLMLLSCNVPLLGLPIWVQAGYALWVGYGFGYVQAPRNPSSFKSALIWLIRAHGWPRYRDRPPH